MLRTDPRQPPVRGAVTADSARGPRPHQEDRFVVGAVDLGGILRGHLVAVLDGHGGDEAAELCARALVPAFLKAAGGGAEEALRAAVVHYEVSVPEALPEVLGDGRALQHCLLNLLDNAVKYSRERKDIRVAVVAGEGHVRLAVSHRGIRIPEDEQDRIFEKFPRGETGLVHDVKGAVLGLSLVEMLVHAHHGRVEVTSTPGEGSTFTILLPVWDGGHGSTHG